MAADTLDGVLAGKPVTRVHHTIADKCPIPQMALATIVMREARRNAQPSFSLGPPPASLARDLPCSRLCDLARLSVVLDGSLKRREACVRECRVCHFLR